MKVFITNGTRLHTLDGYMIVRSANEHFVYVDIYRANEEGAVVFNEHSPMTFSDIDRIMKQWDGKNHKVEFVCDDDIVYDTVDYLIYLVGESANPDKVHLDWEASDFIYNNYPTIANDLRNKLVDKAVEEYNAL